SFAPAPAIAPLAAATPDLPGQPLAPAPPAISACPPTPRDAPGMGGSPANATPPPASARRWPGDPNKEKTDLESQCMSSNHLDRRPQARRHVCRFFFRLQSQLSPVFPHEIQQALAQRLAPAHQPRFHRSQRYLHDIGDFLVRKIFNIAQHHGCAEGFRHLPQRLLYSLPRFFPRATF